MGIFVPLGIPDFNGSSTKGYVALKYTIYGQQADKVDLEVRRGGTTFFKHTVTDASKLRVGSHEYRWDGFDDNGILDTAFYTGNDFNFLSRIYVKGQAKFAKAPFKCTYKEVDWVDVRIDKNAMRIDVTIRVDLRDGGDTGTERDCKEMGESRRAPMITICPWDEIPDTKIQSSQPVIKARTKSFEDLKKMALDGVEIYWSRKGKKVTQTLINGENWEIVVSAKADENGMAAPKIIYFTNSKLTNFTRSHNWEASRKLFYKIGYLKRKTDWRYIESNSADENFKHTAAHEIGHEILLAYGGQSYSKKHKGTSTWLQGTVENTPFPNSGEIDLMVYSDDQFYPRNYFERSVASEDDVMSLVWLSKVNIQ